MEIRLDGTYAGSRWREQGVLVYLDMTKFHCSLDCQNPDWILFVVTPRDANVLPSAPYENTIFVAHNMDFADLTKIPPNYESQMHFSVEDAVKLDKIGKYVRKKGGKYFPDIKTAIDFLQEEV